MRTNSSKIEMLLIFIAVFLYLPTAYTEGEKGNEHEQAMNSVVENTLIGVWKGKLGDKDIVACFNEDYLDHKTGSYYYLKYKNPIRLNKTVNNMTWEEEIKDKKTGIWLFNKIEDGKVKGTWSNNSKDKELSIELTYIFIADKENGKACGSDEYNAVLEYVPSLEIGKIMKFKNKKYRTLRVADVVTLELLSDVGMTKEINKQLYSMLPKTKEDLQEYFEVRREYLGTMGFPAEAETSTEPYYWSSDYVTIHFFRWDVGTGRVGIHSDYRTWNIKTAKEVDLWSWFNPKWLDRRLKADDSCKAQYDSGKMHLTLEDNGMKFWDEYAFEGGEMCETNFLIPYSKIGAFMNAKGKEALKSFLKNEK